MITIPKYLKLEKNKTKERRSSLQETAGDVARDGEK
jgi:hypothetical protein